MDILNLPENFTYLHISNNDEECIFRIKEVTDEKLAYAWLDLYSEKTKSTWRKAQTFPKCGRFNVFKVILRCVHNTDRRVTGLRSSKHTGCKVKMTISVKKTVERAQVQNNDLLNKEYPTIVALKGSHNHPTSTCDTLKYRDLSSGIKSKFTDLFKQGHTPASAIRRHKKDLRLKYGDDYEKIAADGRYVPSYSIVHKLFQNEHKKEDKTLSREKNVFESLEKFLNNYVEKTGAVAKFNFSSDNEHYFIVLCTPMMLRAHEKLPQTCELVMLDTSKKVNQDGHHIYFFVTFCAAGAIPIGIIITDTDNENVFIEAVQCFKDCLPKYAFFLEQYPHVLMIDDDLAVISGLKYAFPFSKLLFCHYHVLKTVWKCLSDSNHSIEQENRQQLFFKFRKLLYSQDQDVAKRNLNELIERATQLNLNNFILSITNFMEQERMWINFYREGLQTCGTNAYAELVFRLLKESMLNKVKSFNITQLVEYLVSHHETYYTRRLIDIWNGKHTNTVLEEMIPHCIPENVVIQVKGFGIFSVREENNELFYVSLEQGMCSCSDNSEELCRHSSAVLLKLDNDIVRAHKTASAEDKEIIFYIAKGVSPQIDKYPSVQASPVKVLELSKQLEGNLSEVDTNVTHLRKNDDIAVAQDVEPFSSEEIEKLKSFLSRITDGLKKDPQNYVPVVRTFSKKFSSLTDAEFLASLNNFGKYNKRKTSNVNLEKTISRKRHKSRITVQPIAIGKKNLYLSREKKLCTSEAIEGAETM